MKFENAFELAGGPDEVIAVFEDGPLLAGFLPGASVGERKEDGSYPGLLTVSFGPKRLNFKGTLTNTVQREQLAGELDGQAKVGTVNVDEARNLSVKYGVKSIPLLLFFKDGEVKDQIVGANVTKEMLKQKLLALA